MAKKPAPKKRGRPRTGYTKEMHVRVTPAVSNALTERAKQTGLLKAALLRAAIDKYLAEPVE